MTTSKCWEGLESWGFARRSPPRGLGEQAAIETLERFLRSKPDAEALLLFEDSDIHKRRAIVDERVSLISTGELLRELEAAGFIQSATYILDKAAASGRNMDRQRTAGQDATTRERLRQQLVERRDAFEAEE